MPKLSPDTLIKQLNWRYAVKKFDSSRKIAAADWELLEESLRLAPSSYGLQPWRFLIVQSPEVRKKLTPASWGQQQVENCSHFVVLTHLKTLDEAYVERYINDIASQRAMAAADLKGFRDAIVGDVVHGPRAAVIGQWAARQAYIAMGSLMTVAALLHVDACPMEGLVPAQYDNILGLAKTSYTTVAAVALGYRAVDDELQHAKKVRFAKKEVFQFI